MQADFAAFENSFSAQARHSLSPPSLYCPSSQGTHFVSVPLVQGDSYPLPTAQDEHGMQADLASLAISLVGQVSQLLPPPPEKEFPGHGKHVAMSRSRSRYSPTGHGTQADFSSVET
jgi:hypothetical protein